MDWLSWSGWLGITGIVASLAFIVGVFTVVDLFSRWQREATRSVTIGTVERPGDNVAISFTFTGPRTVYDVAPFSVVNGGEPVYADARNRVSAGDDPIIVEVILSKPPTANDYVALSWEEYTPFHQRFHAAYVRLTDIDYQGNVNRAYQWKARPGQRKNHDRGRWVEGQPNDSSFPTVPPVEGTPGAPATSA